MAPIPFDCGLTPLYSTVEVNDYEDLLTGPLDKRIDKTYQVALMPLLFLVLDHLPREERIRFVFDGQTTYKKFVHLIFRVLRKYKTSKGKPRLAGVKSVPQSMLTEPGDYLAYAITQTNRDKHSQKSDWCSPIILQMLRPDVSPIVGHPSRQDVRDVIASAKG